MGGLTGGVCLCLDLHAVKLSAMQLNRQRLRISDEFVWCFLSYSTVISGLLGIN